MCRLSSVVRMQWVLVVGILVGCSNPPADHSPGASHYDGSSPTQPGPPSLHTLEALEKKLASLGCRFLDEVDYGKYFEFSSEPKRSIRLKCETPDLADDFSNLDDRFKQFAEQKEGLLEYSRLWEALPNRQLLGPVQEERFRVKADLSTSYAAEIQRYQTETVEVSAKAVEKLQALVQKYQPTYELYQASLASLETAEKAVAKVGISFKQNRSPDEPGVPRLEVDMSAVDPNMPAEETIAPLVDFLGVAKKHLEITASSEYFSSEYFVPLRELNPAQFRIAALKQGKSKQVEAQATLIFEKAYERGWLIEQKIHHAKGLVVSLANGDIFGDFIRGVYRLQSMGLILTDVPGMKLEVGGKEHLMPRVMVWNLSYLSKHAGRLNVAALRAALREASEAAGEIKRAKYPELMTEEFKARFELVQAASTELRSAIDNVDSKDELQRLLVKLSLEKIESQENMQKELFKLLDLAENDVFGRDFNSRGLQARSLEQLSLVGSLYNTLTAKKLLLGGGTETDLEVELQLELIQLFFAQSKFTVDGEERLGADFFRALQERTKEWTKTWLTPELIQSPPEKPKKNQGIRIPLPGYAVLGR